MSQVPLAIIDDELILAIDAGDQDKMSELVMSSSCKIMSSHLVCAMKTMPESSFKDMLSVFLIKSLVLKHDFGTIESFCRHRLFSFVNLDCLDEMIFLRINTNGTLLRHWGPAMLALIELRDWSDPRLYSDKIGIAHHRLHWLFPDHLQALIMRGFLIETRSSDGYTPLFYACSASHFELTQVLLDEGADPLVAGNDGRTPMDVAKGAVAKLLQLAIESRMVSAQAHGDILNLGD